MCVAITGCQVGTNSEEDEKKKEGVFDPMIQSLDKANQVEQQVLDQHTQMDQASEDAEADLEDGERESDDGR